MTKLEENMGYFEIMVKKVSMAKGLDPATEADLLQEIFLGVATMEAGEVFRGKWHPFDESQGAVWLTHMHNMAQDVIRRYFNERLHDVVPLSRYMGEQWAAARKVRGQLSQELGREPRNREVAAAMNLTLDQLEELRQSADFSQVSGDELASGDSDSACVEEDYVGFEETAYCEDTGILPRPEPTAMALELETIIDAALDGVTQAEGTSLALLFGLRDNHPHTLREAGVAMGISHEMVRKHRDTALAKLRHRLPPEIAAVQFALDGRNSA